MKKRYLSEVQTEIEKSFVRHEVFKEEELLALPEPVQRYFRYSGYLGKEKMVNAKFIWDIINFKLKPGKPWAKIHYDHYVFVLEPARITYTKMSTMPVACLESYLDGQGKMLGKLLNIITLFAVKGHTADVSAAVTFLSEILLVPNCILQPYVSWQAIDSSQVKVSFNYKDVKAEGIFTFNEKGELIKFVSDDRYLDTGEGKPEKHKWTIEASNYISKNGIKFPSQFKAIWNLPEGDYEYFNAVLKEVLYNLTKAN